MSITLIFVLFISTICQTSILPCMSVYGASPDFFLIFVVFFSLNADIKKASFVNLLTGITKDLFSEGKFGLSSVLFIITGYILGNMREHIFKEHTTTQIFIVFLVVLAYNFTSLFCVFVSTRSVDLLSAAQQSLYVSIYTAIFSPLLFAVFKRLRSGLGLSRLMAFEKK